MRLLSRFLCAASMLVVAGICAAQTSPPPQAASRPAGGNPVGLPPANSSAPINLTPSSPYGNPAPCSNPATAQPKANPNAAPPLVQPVEFVTPARQPHAAQPNVRQPGAVRTAGALETVPTPEGDRIELPPLPISPSILSDEVNPINLEAAFQLGGVRNPQIRLAGQRVSQAVAERQYAIAQVLPTINLGTNYDDHNGVLQQSSGNILKVNRNALFLGAGANAIAAGSVNIPGVVWDENLGVALFNFLQARQLVAERQATVFATSNHMLLEVAASYLQLMRAEQARAIAVQIRAEAREVARITASYAATGQGARRTPIVPPRSSVGATSKCWPTKPRSSRPRLGSPSCSILTRPSACTRPTRGPSR